MTELFLGRIEKVQLTEDDYVLITDAVGGRIKTTTIGARGLHNALAKFLAARSDTTPLPVPTRKDFKTLTERVEKLEQAATEGGRVVSFESQNREVCSECGERITPGDLINFTDMNLQEVAHAACSSDSLLAVKS